MRLSARWRWWSAYLAAFATIAAAGLRWQPEAYAAPVFAPIRSIMPLTWWSTCWAICGLAAGYAALTRRQIAWRLAAFMSVGLAVAWITGLTWSHFVDHAKISPTGWALWAWLAVSQFLIATSDRQFDRGTP